MDKGIAMKRYVNIYKDEDGRFISDVDHPTRVEAETNPTIDGELILETVRLLSKEEEDAIDGLLKQAEQSKGLNL